MSFSTISATIKTLDRSALVTHGRERRAGPADAGLTTRTVPALVRMLTAEEMAQQAGGNAPQSLGYLMVENTAANLALLGISDLSEAQRDTLRGAHITNIGHDCSYYVIEARPMAQRGGTWLYLRVLFNDNSPAR